MTLINKELVCVPRRVMLICGKQTRVSVYIFICMFIYMHDESRGDSRANQRAFVLRMNGNRRAYGTLLTSTRARAKCGRSFAKILRDSRDRKDSGPNTGF